MHPTAVAAGVVEERHTGPEAHRTAVAEGAERRILLPGALGDLVDSVKGVLGEVGNLHTGLVEERYTLPEWVRHKTAEKGDCSIVLEMEVELPIVAEEVDRIVAEVADRTAVKAVHIAVEADHTAEAEVHRIAAEEHPIDSTAGVELGSCCCCCST